MCAEFGFSLANFTEMEQEQAYTVRVGFLSGRPSENTELNFIVEFISDTAGNHLVVEEKYLSYPFMVP